VIAVSAFARAGGWGPPRPDARLARAGTARAVDMARSVYFAHDSRTASVLRAHPRHGDLS
jgi:uncharacterized protein YkwD